MKKKRVTFDQRMVLQSEFDKNQDWGADKLVELSQRLGLTRTKVYKWHYDRVRAHKAAAVQGHD